MTKETEFMNGRAKVFSGVVALCIAANLIVGFFVHSAAARRDGQEEGYVQVRQFAKVLKVVRQNYVDEDKVGYKDLVHGAMRGMLRTLDPFSAFMAPKHFDRLREEAEGEFTGIGVMIQKKDNALTVLSPMEGSPGMKAGLRANDRIMKVNGEDVMALSLAEAVAKIKGEIGTKVQVTIFRPATNETLTIEIERAKIPIETVVGTRFIEPGLAYLRLTLFSDKTAGSLEKAIVEFGEQDMKGLIVDLRHNGGGVLGSAVDVCSLFLEDGALVVSTEGRREFQRETHEAGDGKKFLELPLVILINEHAASASEIMAGCLQDYKVAALVGEKSFGKGSVQRLIPLEDGSAVKLTVAKYYTPSRRVIDGKGIEPDHLVAINDEDSRKLYERRSRRIPGTEQPPSEDDIADLQLEKAAEVLKQRIAAKDQPAAI